MSCAQIIVTKSLAVVRATLVPCALLLFSWSALATEQETFLHTNTAHPTMSPTGMTITESILRGCFTSGTCTATPANNIFMYPIKCSGSGNRPCTGCWKRVGVNQVRVSDLNGSNSCPAGQIKVYVGYQMTCPGTSPCTNGKLLLGCSIQKIGATDGDNSMVGYDRECFGGTPYAAGATAPTVCEAGKYKDSAGNCVACASGTFKAGEGDSVSLCTACPSPRILPGGGGSGSGTVTTPLGSTSVNDCTYGTITCDNSLWTPNISSQTCIAPVCNLGVVYTAINPNSAATPSATLGQILPIISGATGDVTTSIVSSTPTTSPNSQTGTSPTFGGLAAGTYTINAADAVCFRQFTATLVDSPDCNLRLAISVTNPCNSPTFDNGSLIVNINGANGGASSVLSSPNGTQTSTGTPASFSSLSANSYTIRVTDSVCTTEVGATLSNYVPPAKCPIGQFLNAGSCAACPDGTYKKDVGDFACTPCYRAPIPNGSIVGYSTSPSSGATSLNSCNLSYNCNAGYTPGGSSPIQVNDPSVSCTL